MIPFSHLRKVYESSPTWVKSLTSFLPTGTKFGKSYRNQLSFLAASSNWTKCEYIKYQEEKLFDLVYFAATTVPYYRDIFKKIKLPAQFTSMEQFLTLPLIDKEVMKEHGDRMVSEAVPKNQRYLVSTGGTSGTPVSFWMSADAFGAEWAFVHDLIGRYGLSPKDRKIGLRGVRFPRSEKGIYHQFNPIYNELQISPFHLNAQTLEKLTEKIIKFNPVYIHGYPSSVIQFLSIAQEQGWDKHLHLSSILLVSEAIYPTQLQYIKSSFGFPVISFYGHSERLIFAGSCPDYDEYLVDPRYGYTEVIDGELVGTGFLNKATPMLRYRTGDYANLKNSEKEAGLSCFSRMRGVVGRWFQEMLVGHNGELISVTALNLHSDHFAHVRQFQFFQDKEGFAELRIIPSEDFQKDSDVKKLDNELSTKVKGSLTIEVKIVNELDKTVRGKQMFLVQRLPITQKKQALKIGNIGSVSYHVNG